MSEEAEEFELFMGLIKVKKIILVDDHRFILPDTDEKVDVRPVSLKQLNNDKAKLAQQELFLFPQPGDMIKQIFLVYYDRNIDINKKD